MILTAPLCVPVSKKKAFTLNLNVYRNAHYHVLNTAKRAYKEHMSKQIICLPTLDKIRITYVLFPKTKRLTDISNVLSIHDKMFCDALVELGKLPDDNYKYIPEIHYRMGEVDKLNPRVVIYIEEL